MPLGRYFQGSASKIEDNEGKRKFAEIRARMAAKTQAAALPAISNKFSHLHLSSRDSSPRSDRGRNKSAGKDFLKGPRMRFVLSRV